LQETIFVIMAESIPISIPTYDFSVETYHKMADKGILKPTDRVELIEGKIITMSPMKSAHAACIRRLGDILRHILGTSVIISEEKAITLGTHSEPEPDVAVLKYQEDYYEAGHPEAKDVLLVIEVSLTTQKYDRETKIPLYASYGIPEAWIVDLKQKVIEVHQKPVGDNYTVEATYKIIDTLTSMVIEKLAVNRVIKK